MEEEEGDGWRKRRGMIGRGGGRGMEEEGERGVQDLVEESLENSCRLHRQRPRNSYRLVQDHCGGGDDDDADDGGGDDDDADEDGDDGDEEYDDYVDNDGRFPMVEIVSMNHEKWFFLFY